MILSIQFRSTLENDAHIPHVFVQLSSQSADFAVLCNMSEKSESFFSFRVLIWNIKLRFIQIVKLGERNLIWYNLAELYRNEFIFSLIRKYFLRENEFCFSVEFRSVSEENGYWNIGYIFGKLLKVEDIIIDPLKITIFSHLYS